ncbi:MAG: 6-phosphogluconolactonase [Cyclobacteriaceae bacterium]
MKKYIYSDKSAVAEAFSEYLVSKIRSTDGPIHIALSGGSTPKVVFDFLAENFSNMDWSTVRLYWGDERCVPPDDEESNYRMTRLHLLDHIGIPDSHVFRIKGENEPEREAEAYAQLLREQLPVVNGVPQFDLVILGMGDDGHTASIFPHNIALWDSDRLCEVATHPDSSQQRVTITGEVINHAKTVAFLVTGQSKQEKVTIVLNDDVESKSYPAGLVNPASGNLLWFLDEDAAGT